MAKCNSGPLYIGPYIRTTCDTTPVVEQVYACAAGCGFQVDATDKFCRNCGATLEVTEGGEGAVAIIHSPDLQIGHPRLQLGSCGEVGADIWVPHIILEGERDGLFDRDFNGEIAVTGEAIERERAKLIKVLRGSIEKLRYSYKDRVEVLWGIVGLL